MELAYATTAHGVQGDTVTAAHLVVGEHTGAASAYVGMTRGRPSNTAHLVADGLEDAREQWVAVFARDRADLGPAHAAEQAAREARDYATPRPLEAVLGELHRAWDREARLQERLEWDEPRRDALREIVVLRREQPAELAAAQERSRHARHAHQQAKNQLQSCDAVIAGDTDRYREHLLSDWNADRVAARQAADTVNRGPGPFGLRLAAVNRAREELARWSVKWQPYLPDMPTGTEAVVHFAARVDNQPRTRAAFEDHAHHVATTAHRERDAIEKAAHAASTHLSQAWADLEATRDRHEHQLSHYGSLGHAADPEAHLARLERDVTTTRGELDTTRQQITHLSTDPALRVLPAGQLAHEHDRWRAGYDGQRRSERQQAQDAVDRAQRTGTEPELGHQRHNAHAHDFGRDSGPSMGR